jgi:hypothetical protein
MSLKYQLMGYLKFGDRIGPGFFDGGRAGGFGDQKTVDACLTTNKRSDRELLLVDPSKDAVINQLINYVRVIAFKKATGFY